MFSVSIPNPDTPAAVVETATKCLAMPPRPPNVASDHSRAVRAFVIVSSVVNVLEQTTNGFRRVEVARSLDEIGCRLAHRASMTAAHRPRLRLPLASPSPDAAGCRTAGEPRQGARGDPRALAAIAGWLDGLTFVALGSVFVSAVTGDLVQVGIATADGDAGRLVTLLVALGAYLAGTSLAVTLVRTFGNSAWPGPVRRPLLLHVGLLIVFAGLLAAAGDPERGSAGAAAVVGVAAVSAGVQGAAILGLGIRGATVNACDRCAHVARRRPRRTASVSPGRVRPSRGGSSG
jgi:hypothetical protein